MTGWLVGEVVHLSGGVRSDLPNEFTWRGRRHRVRRVEGYQLRTQIHAHETSRRKYYTLRTVNGLRCVLAQDVNRGIWTIDRVLTNGGGG